MRVGQPRAVWRGFWALVCAGLAVAALVAVTGDVPDESGRPLPLLEAGR